MKTIAEDIGYLMNLWDKCRAAWIEKMGNDEGFSKWFTQQIEREKS